MLILVKIRRSFVGNVTVFLEQFFWWAELPEGKVIATQQAMLQRTKAGIIIINIFLYLTFLLLLSFCCVTHFNAQNFVEQCCNL